MKIGVPAEVRPGETRVAASPETVKKLVAGKHTVVVQSGAGVPASFTDEAYAAAGAVLGDLGQYREALRAIEAGFLALADDEQWLLEDLFYEKVTVLEALGLPEAAVATCEAGLQACPGSALLRAALVPAERARVRSHLKVLRGGQG